jgi:hypothetical protein
VNAGLRAACGAALAGTLLPAPAAADDAPTSPEAVVAAQLDAIERAGWGEARAFGQAYALTSARHRLRTGPLPQFTEVLYRHYAPLLAPHVGLDFCPVYLRGDVAEQRVTVWLEDGSAHDYVFRVVRGTSRACPACWHTDGIYEVAPTAPFGLPGGRSA